MGCREWITEQVLSPVFLKIPEIEVAEIFENKMDEELPPRPALEHAFDSTQWDLSFLQEETSMEVDGDDFEDVDEDDEDEEEPLDDDDEEEPLMRRGGSKRVREDD